MLLSEGIYLIQFTTREHPKHILCFFGSTGAIRAGCLEKLFDEAYLRF